MTHYRVSRITFGRIAANNLQRVLDADVDDGVFPIHADARALPFAPQFFDAIVSIDSFVYYGTDDLYLNYLARFLKPGGVLGGAGAGVMLDEPIASISTKYTKKPLLRAAGGE